MRSNRPPLLLPVALVIIGVVLLLRNFLLIDNVDLLRYWPLLLIAAGLQMLWRGDLGFTWQAQTFGITRGNVQSAALEASSGELDVKVRALRREGRLIAGQYTARSRPALGVRGTHARLSMQRGATWLLSLADWEIGLARDLPWNLLLSAHLGDLDVDLRSLNVEQANLATGIGDLRIVASDISVGGVYGCSTFGSVTLVIPPEVEAVIHVQTGAIARLQVDETRYLMLEPGVYATLHYEQSAQPLTAKVSSTFGNIRLV